MMRPSELEGARVDWTGLTLLISDLNARQSALAWLSSVFPSRLDIAETSVLILDGPAEVSRLPVEFEVAEGESIWIRSSLGTVEGEIDFRPPAPTSSSRNLPFIACHSVKGGTGRTTTAVAIAAILARRQSKPVLFVDADLEAPGLSYLFRESRPEALVSLEDIVALAHSEVDQNFSRTVQWAAERLSTHRFGDVIILPLRRNLDELARDRKSVV